MLTVNRTHHEAAVREVGRRRVAAATAVRAAHEEIRRIDVCHPHRRHNLVVFFADVIFAIVCCIKTILNACLLRFCENDHSAVSFV